MKFKSYLILAILLLVIIIFIQNTEVVNFKIYFWKISISRIILLPSLLIVGFIVGYITAKIHRYKSKKNHENPDHDSVNKGA